MVDLQKLDAIIDDLGESTANFVKISNIAEKVEQGALLMDESVVNLSKVINEVHDLNVEHSDMQDAIRLTYQNLEEHFKAVQLQNAQFSSQANTLLLEIKNESHSLNKQLQNALEAKMDIMKSDIMLENRSKTVAIQEQVSNAEKNLGNSINASKTEVINANATLSHNNQSAITGKFEELFKAYEEQLQGKYRFLKNISISSICLLLIVISFLFLK